METISNSVGKNGKNELLDVKTIQTLLKANLPANPAVSVDGQYGPRTFKAILQYQMSVFPSEKDWDGRVSPKGMTLKSLNDPKTRSARPVKLIEVEMQALKLGGYATPKVRAATGGAIASIVPLRLETSAYKGPSGIKWISEFEGSTSLDDLAPLFRENFKKFWDAMLTAGFKLPQNAIAATFRPLERAYLMHWAYKIAVDGFDPRQVPMQKGVNIEWAHLDSKGAYDPVASKNAAKLMNNGYRSKYCPSLTSNHIAGNAVDMSYSWGTSLSIVDGNKKTVTIASGTFADCTALHAVAATYGVIKHPTDPPHWSVNGR
jgi:peptidoglycan hydrolase-like protein with peptidoglycan-binding domain